MGIIIVFPHRWKAESTYRMRCSKGIQSFIVASANAISRGGLAYLLWETCDTIKMGLSIVHQGSAVHYRSTYVVVDLYASSSRKHESQRQQKHPPYVPRDDDRIIHVGVIEDEHEEKDNETAELTAERGGVVEH